MIIKHFNYYTIYLVSTEHKFVCILHSVLFKKKIIKFKIKKQKNMESTIFFSTFCVRCACSDMREK